MTDSVYFVKSSPLTAFFGSFQNFAYTCILHSEDVHEFDAEKDTF